MIPSVSILEMMYGAESAMLLLDSDYGLLFGVKLVSFCAWMIDSLKLFS